MIEPDERGFTNGPSGFSRPKRKEENVHLIRRAALLACIVPVLAAALAPPAAAQQAGPDQCDPTLADSVHASGATQAEIIAIFVGAPSALLLMPEACLHADQPLGFWRDHVSGYLTGAATFSGSRVAFAHSAGVEVFALGGYSELRLDRYHLSGGVSMFDVRAGYLIHPSPGTAGGVTVGWRQVSDRPDGWSGGGLLVGFPIFIAGCEGPHPCWLQWEPAYMISGGGLGFTPRFRLAVPIPRTPLLGRLDLEAKGMRKADPVSVSLGFGLRP
jgi:hypothetical protein